MSILIKGGRVARPGSGRVVARARFGEELKPGVAVGKL
jgi:hypothetical protein